MKSELKKRIITSLFLLSLLTAMFFYSFVMITALIVIAMIVWIEFYALISKILKTDSNKDKIIRFISKSISLFGLFFIFYRI